MKINQAFTILSKYGDIRCAKIILQHYTKPSFIHVWWMAMQLKRGMPVAKIINQKWFYGLQFYTNRHTLDPRPDTETLVESVIKDKHLSPKILEIGTGSGCIICSLVKNISGATGIGFDKSRRAKSVAIKNVKKLGLTNQIKIKSARFKSSKKSFGKFDIIVSNPPYIKPNDVDVNRGAMFDPKMSLYAKHNGLSAYMEIAKSAKFYLKPNGFIYLEIGIGQEKDVRDIFEKQGWTFISQTPDLSGIIRVLKFTI